MLRKRGANTPLQRLWGDSLRPEGAGRNACLAGCFRLNAVGQLSMVNDCSHPKLSLNGVFLAGPLYTSKLSLQAYSSRVTAFARVEVALPTLRGHPAHERARQFCSGCGHPAIFGECVPSARSGQSTVPQKFTRELRLAVSHLRLATTPKNAASIRSNIQGNSCFCPILCAMVEHACMTFWSASKWASRFCMRPTDKRFANNTSATPSRLARKPLSN